MENLAHPYLCIETTDSMIILYCTLYYNSITNIHHIAISLHFNYVEGSPVLWNVIYFYIFCLYICI